MSAEYSGQDPLDIAKKAEADLNTLQAKGNATMSSKTSDSARESGIDESAADKFPGATVTVGSAASGAGDNREIPLEEGGSVKPDGKLTKASDFEGEGGPEDKARRYAEEHGGDNDVRENVRQGGETVRPPGQVSNSAQDGTGHRTA